MRLLAPAEGVSTVRVAARGFGVRVWVVELEGKYWQCAASCDEWLLLVPSERTLASYPDDAGKTLRLVFYPPLPEGWTADAGVARYTATVFAWRYRPLRWRLSEHWPAWARRALLWVPWW